MEKMKVVMKLDEVDKKKHNIGLSKFFNAAKDASKKYVTTTLVGRDEPVFYVKAIAVSRALTIIGEGKLMQDDYTDGETDERGELKITDKFENAGFVYVKKIVED